jgi:hypothetical protein
MVELVPDSLNLAQTKLLANFSSDLAKGLLLAGISAPFISKEVLAFKGLLTLFNSIMAAVFLKVAVDMLKGVKE